MNALPELIAVLRRAREALEGCYRVDLHDDALLTLTVDALNTLRALEGE